MIRAAVIGRSCESKLEPISSRYDYLYRSSPPLAGGATLHPRILVGLEHDGDSLPSASI